jgi:DNA-binding transcriptional MerR regulator
MQQQVTVTRSLALGDALLRTIDMRGLRFYISPMREFEKYRARDLGGMDRLVAAANQLLTIRRRAYATTQPSLVVTNRSVRNYLNEGLLGEPTRASAGAEVFNYANLLRLLSVKLLLADNWSLVKIRQFMSLLDLTALEQFVDGRPASGTPNNRLAEAEERSRIVPSARTPAAAIKPPRPVSLFGPTPAPSPLAALALESARRAAAAEWIELAPGLEIRVRRGFRRPNSDAGHAALVDRFRAILDHPDRG